jgi:Tfp pilus assembly protein PilX
MARQKRTLRSEHGSALVVAILAMLIVGVFGLSIAVLADLETRIGINHKAAQQAFALAETGLEHGRNAIRDAVPALTFDAFITSATTRRLGMPSTGIALGAGRYWVRVDNDCATPAGFAGSPAFVPAVVQDSGGSCADDDDTNETVVLTAWAEATDGPGRVIGRARLRAHYTIGNPWKHSCYNANGQLCIDDAVGGCNSNPCIDPSDPRHPNGPAKGTLPIPSDIRCGTVGSGPYPPIPPSDIPIDVQASGAIGASAPCVIYPYYLWALKTPAPTREVCARVIATGYGTNDCGPGVGTIAFNAADLTCTTSAPGRCHGMVFFGPGTSSSALATGADVTIGTSGIAHAGCLGTQNDSSSRPCYDGGAPDSSVVVYVMGKATITNNVEVNGTVVLHGNEAAGGGANRDFGLTGTNRVTTRPCLVGSPAPSPGCGYPLALLGYNPNEVAPTTATGQTLVLDLSNSTSLITGLIYSGGTADFNPLTVDGGLIAWDVNITNTASRITYNPTYGNAAPPPAFITPTDGSGILMYPATWVRCTNYQNDFSGPTPCS